MNLGYETTPKENGTAYDSACDLIELAYWLDDPEGDYVVADGYNELVWLVQPGTGLVTVIQKSTVPDCKWLDMLAVYQEEYLPAKSKNGGLELHVVMYRLQNDGVVHKAEKSRVGVVGKESWFNHKLEPEQANVLATHLAESTVMPPALVKLAI